MYCQCGCFALSFGGTLWLSQRGKNHKPLCSIIVEHPMIDRLSKLFNPFLLYTLPSFCHHSPSNRGSNLRSQDRGVKCLMLEAKKWNSISSTTWGW